MTLTLALHCGMQTREMEKKEEVVWRGALSITLCTGERNVLERRKPRKEEEVTCGLDTTVGNYLSDSGSSG